VRSIRISHIVLSTKDLADVLCEHLRSYDDKALLLKTFAKMAKKYSACGSRHKGGDLGFLEQHTAAPELLRAAQQAGVMEVSGPVHTRFGYHIFIITEEEALSDTDIDGINMPSLR
jgi:parvulin-like peptidyl-prolyl isomerase